MFHFVTGGIHEALDQARDASKGMDVRIGGGPNTIQQYLRAGLVDEMHVAIAPVLLGGRQARDPLEGEGVEHIGDALRALTLECEKSADDVLIKARLKEW